MHFFWRLKHGDNLSESSFLEALFGLVFSHADFADDADFFYLFTFLPFYLLKSPLAVPSRKIWRDL